jgi:hypothetical protein
VVGRRVRVEHPEEPAVGDDQIRVPVEGKERRDRRHALHDVAVEDDAALGRQVLAQQELERLEAAREEQLAGQSAHRHSASPGIALEDIVVAAREVELAGVGADKHMVVRELAEVDGRLRHLEIDRGLRRQVLDEEDRQALLRHLVHRAERQAVAVGEGEVFVDPRLRRQALRVQLARREHDLPVLAVDQVPVDVDRREVVVGADFLDLAEGVEQRLSIPEPDVADGRRVLLDVRLAQDRVA